MKTEFKRAQTRVYCVVALGMVSSFSLATLAENVTDALSPRRSIPWSKLGAKAAAGYQGEGLAVVPTSNGARLRCVFQRLKGEATPEGLWMNSTVNNATHDRLRVVAADVRRLTSIRNLKPETRNEGQSLLISAAADQGSLPHTGTVTLDGKTVRFTRPGLVEEYTVSMEGVRQDFLVLKRPEGVSELAVRLAVSGARVEASADGAWLVLENSGRKIAYSRLRVTDSTGKELTARMEVVSGILPDVEGAYPAARNLPADFSRTQWQDTPESAGLEAPALRQAGMPAATMLTVLVNDADAVYPVRIDPTFSDANWSSMSPPGPEALVYEAVADGSGNLFIAGEFTLVGDVFANRIAKWDGSSWTALGSGIGGASGTYSVRALAVLGSDLYAGGFFTTAGGGAANYIAKWDGNSWTPVGSGMNATVHALAVSGSDLYAGGRFTTAGGSAANYIAKWDGNSWTAVGSGMNSNVFALAVSRSDLYAGGSFTTAGGSTANYIAKWDGNNWMPLGLGMNGEVDALAASASDVYAGGRFTMSDGSAANYVAKWSGSSWTALGSGVGAGIFGTTVYALGVSGSDLYAGGNFTTAGGGVANFIAKWNGSNWTALGSGIGGDVFGTSVLALLVWGSEVYAGGRFTTAGGIAANYIAKWNGNNWTALSSGSGMDDGVKVMAVSGSDLYAGGLFTTAGASAANYIAKWNGSSWTALGSGISSMFSYYYVSALAILGSDLYAGGYFTSAGASTANNIAKWNGSNWSGLSSGLDDGVNALAVSGSDLYVGGNFTRAGSSTANYIARWNGSSWTALGSGMSSNVLALAVSGDDLYAGGEFRRAGNSTANYIAKWNGSSWDALGSGMNSNVLALAASGSDLYAGGRFTTAGGSAANAIAKWNGSSWTALGSGMSGGSSPVVYALKVSGSDLYAGGFFTTAGDSVANSIAKWNGSSWTVLGSGMGILSGSFPARVEALAVSGSDLYAGGAFTRAGGKVSAYIARAYLPALPSLSVLHSGTQVIVSWPSADTVGFALNQAGSLAAPAIWVTNTATVTDDGANKSVTLQATNSPQFFRLRRP